MKGSAALWIGNRLNGLGSAAGERAAWDWMRHNRTLIAEGYTPPFYPLFEYEAERAVAIAAELQCDSLRYPVASYLAYFPTQSGYPTDPRMKGDPMSETIDVLHRRGMRAVGYIPLNHPFMSAESRDPRYSDWVKRFADGRPMITSHYGFARFFEGCINSPVRELYPELVQEVLSRYDFDVVYFDGPYQGLDHLANYCYCEYCQKAFKLQFGRPIPSQASMTRTEIVQYRTWLTGKTVGFFSEICRLVRARKNIPIMFNDTALLTPTGQWRDRALPFADGFMFEAADTPEQKLFNLDLGLATGKVIWTYIGSYGEYDRDHLSNQSVRGWFSYPIENRQIAMDCAIATAAGAGCKYWGLARFFYQPKPPTDYLEGKQLIEAFQLQQRHAGLLNSLRHQAQAGVLVSDQTIKWYRGDGFVPEAYPNYFHGAYLLLKAMNVEPQPFLDWIMSAEVLSRYSVVYAPNAICLSDAQCHLLRKYVEDGGNLIATHLTSAADESGRMRSDFGLADSFGASWIESKPYEYPDLYLKPLSGELIPQDPQIVRIRATSGSVVAKTISRGQEAELGPAITCRRIGNGSVVYIGSGLEAVFYETLMVPLLSYLRTLVTPLVKDGPAYEMDYVPGIIGHAMTGAQHIVLYIIADIGDRHVDYRPVREVRVRIRVPREPKGVTLLRDGSTIPFAGGNGWAEVVIPRVEVYEAVCVELA
jgi:hypothetical protein